MYTSNLWELDFLEVINHITNSIATELLNGNANGVWQAQKNPGHGIRPHVGLCDLKKKKKNCQRSANI